MTRWPSRSDDPVTMRTAGVTGTGGAIGPGNAGGGGADRAAGESGAAGRRTAGAASRTTSTRGGDTGELGSRIISTFAGPGLAGGL